MLTFFCVCGGVNARVAHSRGDCGRLHTAQYEDGEEVILWVNKVGPYRNPQETYR